MGRGTRDCLNRRLEQDVRRVWFPSLQPWLTGTCEFWGTSSVRAETWSSLCSAVAQFSLVPGKCSLHIFTLALRKREGV